VGSGSPFALGESGAGGGSGECWVVWTSALTGESGSALGIWWNSYPFLSPVSSWALTTSSACPRLTLSFLRRGLGSVWSSPILGAGGRVGQDFYPVALCGFVLCLSSVVLAPALLRGWLAR